MRKHSFSVGLIAALSFLQVQGQQSALLGKWRTPEQTIVEFYSQGQAVTGKLIISENNKSNNDKVIARDVKAISSTTFEGTVIDPKNNKSYQAHL
jgi:uncharacterized protein (DUF2147 family)